jgi:hypothetical protein
MSYYYQPSWYRYTGSYIRTSSHFNQNAMPQYGIDLTAGLLPFHFRHVLFAWINEQKGLNGEIKLAKLFVKCEENGLGTFTDSIRHTVNYLFIPFGDKVNSRREKDPRKGEYEPEKLKY